MCPTHTHLDPWSLHADLETLREYRSFSNLGYGPLSTKAKALRKLRKKNGTLVKPTKVTPKMALEKKTAARDKDGAIIYNRTRLTTDEIQ